MNNSRAIFMLLLATAAGVAAVVFGSRWMISQSSTSTLRRPQSSQATLGEAERRRSPSAVIWPTKVQPVRWWNPPWRSSAASTCYTTTPP